MMIKLVSAGSWDTSLSVASERVILNPRQMTMCQAAEQPLVDMIKQWPWHLRLFACLRRHVRGLWWKEYTRWQREVAGGGTRRNTAPS